MLTLHPEEQAWLDEYRRALKGHHADAVRRLVVYGSKARGDAHDESDIDLLLVVEDAAADMKRPLRRLGHELAVPSLVLPSIMAYTRSEWSQLEHYRSAYHAAVEREGIAVL